MTDLNELFEQILHSERKFKARVDELRLLGSEIEQCQSELQHLRDNIHTKQGELAVKRNKLADQIVETKVIKVRKQILQDQFHTLSKAKAKITSDFESLKKEHDSNRTKFMEELSKFSQYYDLLGSGCKEREDDSKRMIKVLQEELLLLETELIEMNSQKEEVNKLEVMLKDAENELEKARDMLAETRNLKLEVENETKHLDYEKKTIDGKLCQDPEFTRLQSELESCKESTEESTCKRLTEELEELQRQCYHKQMRKQISKPREGPSRSTSTSLRSGHYNPYTHQYIPAPGNVGRDAKNKSLSLRSGTNSDLPKGGEEHELIDDIVIMVDDEAADVNEIGDDEEIMDEWDIGIEENELLSLDDDDIDFVERDIRGARDRDEFNNPIMKFESGSSHCNELKNSKRRALPPPNFSNSKKSLTYKNPTDFQQASSILKQRPASIKQGGNEGVTSKPTVKATNTNTRRYSQRRQTGLTTGVTLESPGPSQVMRKRQGESIYKAPGTQQTQESSLPRRAKKVRFHY